MLASTEEEHAPASAELPLNSGRTYVHHVRRHESGRTLLEVLSDAYRHSSASEWQAHAEAGRVHVEGCVSDGTATVGEGQRIEYHRQPWREPPAPMSALSTLHEDSALLALNKPPGLPVLPSEVYWDNTVVAALRTAHEKGTASSDVPHPVHRLGVGTSGVLLCAIGAPARAALSRAFEGRSIHKTYRTLVTGLARRPKRKHGDDDAGDEVASADTPKAHRHVSAPSSSSADSTEDGGAAEGGAAEGGATFEITCPIGPVPHCSWGGTVHGARPDGGTGAKPARSIVRVLRRDAARGRSLVEVQIPTGRPHQIRIHMAYAGHPLVDDPLYAAGGVPIAPPPGSDARPALPRDAGYLLHAWRAELDHPTSGKRLVLLAPPPAELALEGEAVSKYA